MLEWSSVAAAKQDVSVAERLQMALERLLDTGEDKRGATEEWHTLGLAVFEAGWDNPEDAIYDNWRRLYCGGKTISW